MRSSVSITVERAQRTAVMVVVGAELRDGMGTLTYWSVLFAKVDPLSAITLWVAARGVVRE